MDGANGSKTNSAFNWVEVEVEAELGKSYKKKCEKVMKSLKKS